MTLRNQISRNSALKIAIVFFAFSALWIFLSDKLLIWLFSDASEITGYQTAKGIFFVLITTLLIYSLVYKEIRRKNQVIRFLNESERWYNLMFSNIPKIDVLMFDPDEHIILAQGKEMAKHGVDLSAIQGRQVNDIRLAESVYDYFYPVLKKVLAGHTLESTYRYRKDMYRVRGVPLKDENKKVFAGIIVLVNVSSEYKLIDDITEQKQRYESLYNEFYDQNEQLKAINKKLDDVNSQLETAKEKAEESDRLKSSFLSNMSHEIRTPLNGIMGFSQIIADNQLSIGEVRAYAEILERNASQLLTIIEDLLLISSLETGQFQYSEMECSPKDCFNQILSDASKLILQSGKNIQLINPYDDRLNEALLICDEPTLIKAVKRIVDNAVKYSPENSLISISMFMDKDTKLCVEVKDEGPGIPKDMQEKVFERFIQLNRSLNEPVSGNGLGLTIAKGIIEGMEGSIRLDSSIGKGSRFILCIPGVIDLENTKTNEDMDSEYLQKSGNKVLIVEDVKDNFILLKAYLKDYDIELLHASSGKEAKDIVDAQPDIDLILMDIRLPDANGLQLTRDIRKESFEGPIIAQTAYADSQDHYDCRQAGCDDFISKPIMKNDFIDKLSKYMNIKKKT
ncbi:MAG: response regulator [Bacteroidota bacterium]